MTQVKNQLQPDCASMARDATKIYIESVLPTEVEVFYANTSDLGLNYSDFIGFISNEEQIRAAKFHFTEDREAFVFSHAYLRFILASRLMIRPEEIQFGRDAFNKPILVGLPYNFNITHTKQSFAVAVSQYYNVGIDMENISRKTDQSSIVKSFFSAGDQQFIDDPEGVSTDRFFLLWTRKEALLKAIGIGITTDLTQYEVQDETDSSDDIQSDMDFHIYRYSHHIYTKKIAKSYLSIASPSRAIIKLNQLNNESFKIWE
jgi:4'-phosphopantetheinyl transferase